MLRTAGFIIVLLLSNLQEVSGQPVKTASGAILVVLGTAQDGGFPQAGCKRNCCVTARKKPEVRQMVSSVALADPLSRKWWLFDATPDLPRQLDLFARITKGTYPTLPAGIFLTHAHMGHYSGLLHLGREVMNTKDVPVFVLPRMKQFISSQGPWSQLTTAGNIRLLDMSPDVPINPGEGIRVTAMTVPHRDEFSETAGFRIETQAKKYLYIPDIDKWERWDKNIVHEVRWSDEAFIDATFHDAAELPNRKMEEIPHPLVPETMGLFAGQPPEERRKIRFIHLNHTNPLLLNRGLQKKLGKQGFQVAEQGDIR